MPLLVYQNNHMMNESGVNIDIWSISLVSFTCMYTVVTGKLVLWTRWWTKANFFFYSVMSVLVYIAYMWLSNYWSESKVRYSVVQVNQSPIFYLTLFLVGTSCFLTDLLIEQIRFDYFKNASDYVREMMRVVRNQGEKHIIGLETDEDEMLKISGIQQFMEPIEKSIRIEQLQRE